MDGDFLTIVHSFEAKSIAHAGIGTACIYIKISVTKITIQCNHSISTLEIVI